MIDPTLFEPVCSPYLRRVRPRWQIIRDYALAHGLSAAQVTELVAELPGGSNVVNMKDYRK